MGLVGNVQSETRTIEGNLERIDLASVLQVLQSNGSEGVLEITGSDQTVELFYCSSFGLTLANRADALGRSLLARLLHQGRITPEQFDHVFCETASIGANPVDTLHEMDIIDEHLLVDTLRECLEEEIYSLFFLEAGTFRFRPTAFDSIEQWGIRTMEPLGVPLERVVLEAARRMDEWVVLSKRFPTVKMILEICRDGGNAKASSWRQRLILGLVDSQRSIEEIVALSSLSRYEVCHTLQELAQAGVIRPLAASELVRQGERNLKRNAPDISIKLLQVAIDQGSDDPTVHELLARAFEQRGDGASAARHMILSADKMLAAGDVSSGFDQLSRACNLVPADADVRLHKIDAYLRHSRDLPPTTGRAIADEAIALCRRLVQDGKAAKAVELLRRLDGITRGSLRVKNEMIELLLARGLVTEAIAEYENLGSFLVARNQLEDARKIYRKILALDHRRFDVADKLKRIDHMRVDKRGRRRKVTMVLLALFTIAAGAAAYSMYAQKADELVRRAVARLTSDPTDREQSIRDLKSVSEKFALAPAAREADDEIRRLRVESNFEVVDAQLRRKAKEGEAQQHLDRAIDLVDDGEIEQALVALQQAIDLAPSDAWIHQRDLENQKTRLLDYLQRAENLYRKSRDAARAQDWTAAFDFTRDLATNFSRSPFARMATIPIHIDSIPTGASVIVDGEPTEMRTPCPVLFSLEREHRISLRMPGYDADANIRVDTTSPSMTVVLRRLPRWTFPSEAPIVGRPAASEGILYVGSRDSTLYALDPAEGKVHWKTALAHLAEIESGVVESRGTLFFGANDRGIYAVDRATGEVRWRTDTLGFVKHLPLLRSGLVLAGCSRGNVYALDERTGRIVWSQRIGGSVVASPSPSENSIQVVSSEGRVCSLDPKNGSFLRDHRIEVHPLSGCFVGDRLLVGTDDGYAACYRVTDGKALWSHPCTLPVHAPPTILDGSVLIGSDEGVLRQLALDTGELLASFRAGGMVRGAALVVRDRIYFGSSDRSLYCLDKNTFALAWKGQCGGSVDSDPFEAYGAIYVGCDDHLLYCFEP